MELEWEKKCIQKFDGKHIAATEVIKSETERCNMDIRKICVMDCLFVVQLMTVLRFKLNGNVIMNDEYAMI